MKTNNWPLKWSPCLWHCCIDRQRLPNKINSGWKLRKKNCFIFHFLLLAPYAIRRWKHWFNWSHVLPVYIYVCIHNTIKKVAWHTFHFRFKICFTKRFVSLFFSFRSILHFRTSTSLLPLHALVSFKILWCLKNRKKCQREEN